MAFEHGVYFIIRYVFREREREREKQKLIFVCLFYFSSPSGFNTGSVYIWFQKNYFRNADGPRSKVDVYI